MKTVLSVAGSDPSGGAGIQTDLKTFTALGLYGMAAVTALTVQNTCGVSAISVTSPDFLRAQIECVFDDIYPTAVKVGMTGSAENAEVIADIFRKYHAKNIIIDPVMTSTSGHSLISKGYETVYKEVFLPLADLVTPNLAEAEHLTRQAIKTTSDAVICGKTLRDTLKTNILLTGGHEISDDCNCCLDLLFTYDSAKLASDSLKTASIRFGVEVDTLSDDILMFKHKRLTASSTHGTGCTLSSAVASFAANGTPIPEAALKGICYTAEAIKTSACLGCGHGPVVHLSNFNF